MNMRLTDCARFRQNDCDVMRRGRVRLRSVSGVVLAYLAIGVPAARMWHEATANHRYCPEHRSMEEADSSTGPHSGRPEAPSRPEDHETCPFVPLGACPTLWPAPTVSASPVPTFSVRLRSPGRPLALQSGAILSVAPKTSPPL
jgi:hypothetical protein